jgi:hypothetical protein
MIISADELYDFYAQLGQALHALQNVEGTLHRLLAMRIDFQIERPTPESAERILESYRRQTLGGLIRKAKDHDALESSLLSRLETLNSDRRYVVHRLQEETDGQLRASPDFRRELLRRLERIADSAFAMNRQLTEDVLRREGRHLSDTPAYRAELARQLQMRGFR